MNHFNVDCSNDSHSEWVLACYVINLDRSKDRMIKVTTRLQKLQCVFERISAVDGNGLTENDYVRLTKKNRFYRTLSAGEVGCYMSHLAAMERFLASSASYALILEDDVVLPDDLRNIVTGAIRLRETGLAGVIGDWHVLKLQADRKWHVRIIEILPGFDLVEYGLSVPTCAAAAIWHREGAKRFLDHFIGVTRPVDCELQHPWEFDLQIRSVYPSVVNTEGVSIIGKRKKQRSNVLRKIHYEAIRVIPKLRHFMKTYGLVSFFRRWVRTEKRAW